MINLAGTDLVVSSLCLGTGDIGSSVAGDDAYRLLDMFVDLGGNFLDTAAVYANWLPGEKSISEKTIGRWMQLRHNRNSIVVATKGAHPDLSSMHISRMSPGEIVGDLDASLRHLRTDCIDVYYLHRDDSERPVSQIIDVLEGQVKAGKIRYYACSNWKPARISEAQRYARSTGSHGFVANQLMWSLATVNWNKMPDKTIAGMEPEAYALHRETGLAAIPYTSQARGFFQKMASGPQASLPRSAINDFWNEENQTRLKRVVQLQSQTGLSVTQIVLGYLRSHPFQVIPVVGCKSIAHLMDSMSAQDTVMTRQQVRYLETGN